MSLDTDLQNLEENEDIISDNEEIERQNERASVRNSRSSRRQVENRRTQKDSENTMSKSSKITKNLSGSERKKMTTSTAAAASIAASTDEDWMMNQNIHSSLVVPSSSSLNPAYRAGKIWGTIEECIPALPTGTKGSNSRIPARYRCTYYKPNNIKNVNSSATSHFAMDYISGNLSKQIHLDRVMSSEQVVEHHPPLLLSSCLNNNNRTAKGSNEEQQLHKQLCFPLNSQIRIVQERYQAYLNAILIKNQILPKLLILAALEETCHDHLQSLVQIKKRQNRFLLQQQKRQAKASSSKNDKVSGRKAFDYICPFYYGMQPPSVYLQPYAPPSPIPTAKDKGVKSSKNTPKYNSKNDIMISNHSGTTPSHWISRIRSACHQAQQHYENISQRDQQQSRRSSSRSRSVRGQQPFEDVTSIDGYSAGNTVVLQPKAKNTRMVNFLLNDVLKTDPNVATDTTNDDSDDDDDDLINNQVITNNCYFNHPDINVIDLYKTIRKWNVEDIQYQLKDWLIASPNVKSNGKSGVDKDVGLIVSLFLETDRNSNRDINDLLEQSVLLSPFTVNQASAKTEPITDACDQNTSSTIMKRRQLMFQLPPTLTISKLSKMEDSVFAKTTFPLNCYRCKDQSDDRNEENNREDYVNNIDEGDTDNEDDDDHVDENEELEREKYNQHLLLQNTKFKIVKNWHGKRHRDIHYGYTKWPSWNKAVQNWWRDYCNKKKEFNNNNSTEALQIGGNQQEPIPPQEESSHQFSRRRKNATRNSMNGDETGSSMSNKIFYGNASNVSQKQLMDTIQRFVSNTSPKSLHDLHLILMEDYSNNARISYDTNSFRRIRNAVGKLLYKQNQIYRLQLNWKLTDGKVLYQNYNYSFRQLTHCENSDTNELATAPNCNDMLTSSSTRITSEPQTSVSNVVESKPEEPNDTNKDALCDEEKKFENKSENEKNETMELELLKSYILQLHRTELHLRKAVIKYVTEIPAIYIATAADEKSGTAEALDEGYFQYDDYGDTDNEENDPIQWQSTGHELIGRSIFRPPVMEVQHINIPDDNNNIGSNNHEDNDCQWYEIQDYLSSVISSSLEDNNITSGRVNNNCQPVMVERRMRFRALPISNPLHQQELLNEQDFPTLILTEAQVRVGIVAAEIEKRKLQKNKNDNNKDTINSTSHQNQDIEDIATTVCDEQKSHPFAQSVGSQIILHPISRNDHENRYSNENKKKTDALKIKNHINCQQIVCTIVGYNSILEVRDDNHESCDTIMLSHRVLVLQDEKLIEDGDDDEMESEDSEGSEKDGSVDCKSSTNTVSKTDSSFWITLDINTANSSNKHNTGREVFEEDSIFGYRSDDSNNENNNLLKQQDQKTVQNVCDLYYYKIEQFGYHASSYAYSECESIISYLENHSKIAPFIDPVDPVELGIPEYFDIIKNPMDVSTLITKLEKGLYSKIENNKNSNYVNSVGKMLNGTFRKDVELIFENAMLFNPKEDWIHQAAAAIKKAVVKKITQLSDTAEGGLNNAKSSASHKRQRASYNSIYVAEDSDADEYYCEYSSGDDDDDEFYKNTTSSKRAKRKRGKSRKNGMNKNDDYSSRPIENPIRLSKITMNSEELRGKPFQNFPLETNASSFSLPPQWSCRRLKQVLTNKHSMEEEYNKQNNEEISNKDHTDSMEVKSHEEELSKLVDIHVAASEDFQSISGSRRSSRNARHSNFQEEQQQKTSDNIEVGLDDVEYYVCGEQDYADSTTKSMSDSILRNKQNIISSFLGKHMNNSSDSCSNEAILIDGSINEIDNDSNYTISDKETNKFPRNRTEIECINEKLHEDYYCRLFDKYMNLSPESVVDSILPSYSEDIGIDSKNVVSQPITDKDIDGDIGMYMNDAFPPYLGRIIPLTATSINNENPKEKFQHITEQLSHGSCDNTFYKWEIRSSFVLPALRWIIRGLIHSNHLSEIESLQPLMAPSAVGVAGGQTTATSISASAENQLSSTGIIVPNHVYFYDTKSPTTSEKSCHYDLMDFHHQHFHPYEALDVKELQRRKRSNNDDDSSSSEDGVELSEYEKARAERVARNAERLKALGLG